jgi:hypothetical protein
VFDLQTALRDTSEGLLLHREQTIHSDYLDDLRKVKDASLEHMGNREMHRVASVPVELVERWMSQGFNIYEAPAKDIVKRLQAEQMDAFITTKRSL